MMDFQRFYSRRRLQKPLALLPPSLKKDRGIWADLGCGNGIFSVVLGDLLSPASIVCAIDRDVAGLVSLSEVRTSYTPALPVHPIQADFREALPLAELDGILFANSLHYIPSERRAAVLTCMLGYLKIGGQLIIVEYNTRTAHPAIPYPLDEIEFHRLAIECALTDPQIAARVPSTFGGEMYAGTAFHT